MLIYLIGSLRCLAVPRVAAALRADGHDVYDDWYAAGPEADDHWQRYEQSRGRTFAQAITGRAAAHVFNNDRSFLDRCVAGVLVAPAGKSAHLELGYVVGKGKLGYVLLDKEPARFDVMYRFADGVFYDIDGLRRELKGVA